MLPKMQFSIIIPTRNEEAHLPKCIKSIEESAKIANITYEIIVVLNRCTDRTEEIAISNGCKVIKDESKNLSKIRNCGASIAAGDIIVTVDADSRISKNMFKNISKILASGKYIGGGVLILPERLSLGIIISALLLAPIALYYRIQGGLFFLTKESFQKLGGFNENLYSAEDIDFAKRLKALGKKNGKRFAMLFSSYLITSCRKFDRLGDWYFIYNLQETISLLRGKNKDAANKIWYDFDR